MALFFQGNFRWESVLFLLIQLILFLVQNFLIFLNNILSLIAFEEIEIELVYIILCLLNKSLGVFFVLFGEVTKSVGSMNHLVDFLQSGL